MLIYWFEREQFYFLENQNIAFFPLSIALLPGEEHGLHIFETRYKQLIEGVKLNDAPFVIPIIQNGKMLDFGCKVRLKEILKVYPNGSLDIMVFCSELVVISNFKSSMHPKAFPGGDVSVFNLVDAPASEELLSLFNEVQIKVFNQPSKYQFGNNFTVTEIAAQSNLTLDEKVRFIKLRNVQKMEKLIVNQLKWILLLKKQEEHLDYNFALN